MLGRIDRLRNRGPKHLDTETRLRAARFIRDRYEALLAPKGMRAQEIEDRVHEMGDGLEGLRIHRWMVRATEHEITEELIAKYEGSVQPQKKTRTYFALADALARIASQDGVEAQIDLLRATGLDSRALPEGKTPAADVFDPNAGLVQLLRDFASDAAYRLDLAALFERAQRVQAGWDPEAGPVALMLDEPMQLSRPTTVFSRLWEMNQLPALPSAEIALIPMARLPDATMVLDPQAASPAQVKGTLEAWWRLHLCVAPQEGGGVTPCLLRTIHVTLRFDPEHADMPDERVPILYQRDGLPDLHPGSGAKAVVKLEPPRGILLSQSSAAEYDRLEEAGRLFQRTTPDEILPHEGLPMAEIDPLDASQLALWLRDGGNREYAEILPGRALERQPDQAAPTENAWFRAPCLARDVERAVRNGSLRAEIARWKASYDPSLIGLEKARIKETAEADTALRERWAAERLEMDRNAERHVEEDGKV